MGAVQAGAIGYLLKDTQAADLRQAVKAAAKGMVQLPAPAARMLVNTVCAPAAPDPLTGREKTVLELVARGYSNKEIARALKISDQTVKNHITSILRKLAVNDRTQAVVYALRRGWIKMQEL
jgi:DNA-binding NarL/FixJ family response regulator